MEPPLRVKSRAMSPSWIVPETEFCWPDAGVVDGEANKTAVSIAVTATMRPILRIGSLLAETPTALRDHPLMTRSPGVVPKVPRVSERRSEASPDPQRPGCHRPP